MKKKILIIDDCLPILNSLHMILEMHYYEVEIAQNGRCLLDNNDALPDILLVDYRISGIDGCNLFTQLKNNTQFKHIPVILMSGDIDIERIAVFLGVNDFIAKPFNIDVLLNKIERCIK
ncbi:response regulator [Legionella drancourtii]|uniref:response regulator n=1 Tax=Legionella drancourtii TaxID=168933 RepID=UPI00058F311F|nr:response regulator [Legionella drancourtii]